jgi:hypothetical protein
MFYGIMGHMPEEDGALTGMATALCADHSVETIGLALNRCMRECRFPVRLPDIFLRIPGSEVPKIEAEMRAAWDVLIQFVNKWCRWNDGYFDGENSHVVSARIEPGAPELPQRITDTVRRTGGWATYLRMEPCDFPFQQKRFFEEYQAWLAVERVLPDLAKVLQLPEAQIKQLTGSRTMDNAAQKSTAASNLDVPVKTPAPKSVPEPLTSEQLRDRREMLRQQVETLKAKRVRSEKAHESRLPIPLSKTAEDAGQETVQ